MTTADWIVLVLFAVMFASVGAGLASWFNSLRFEDRDRYRPRLLSLYRSGLTATGTIAVLVFHRLGTYEHVLGAIQKAPGGIVLGVIASMLVAKGLFYLRSRHLEVYAAIEYSVGIATAWIAISPLEGGGRFQPSHDAERVMKILAAVYLMIRAMDNWAKAQENKISKGRDLSALGA